MNRHLPFQQRVLALVVSLLLFAQVFGLHRHVHGDVAAHGAQSELHFGDAGIHADGDVHTHSIDGSTPVTHEHHAGYDVDASALGELLTKLSMDLLPVGLLMVAFLLLVLATTPRVAMQRYAEPALRRSPYALNPPANGPPRLFFTAD